MGLSQLLLSFLTRVLIRYDREFNVDSKAECAQLNLATRSQKNIKKKELKQINVSAHLVQYRFKICEDQNQNDYGGKDLLKR